MEFFLEEGNLAGKIICPNKKCGAKLGNYDWAGVCCSCKEWVTPVSAAIPLHSFLDEFCGVWCTLILTVWTGVG